MYIYNFLSYSLCSKGICQVLQLRLSKARIYSIVSQRYNRLHNHCTQVIRKKNNVLFLHFCLFLKIQLEKMNTKHLGCKKSHVWAKTVQKPDENRRQKITKREKKTLGCTEPLIGGELKTDVNMFCIGEDRIDFSSFQQALQWTQKWIKCLSRHTLG